MMTGIIFLHFQLLLMKRGGQVIYAGELGCNSHKLIEYFEVSFFSTVYTLFFNIVKLDLCLSFHWHCSASLYIYLLGFCVILFLIFIIRKCA